MKQLFYGTILGVIAMVQFGCMNSVATNPIPGAFEYREIYLPHSSQKDNEEMGLNTVDLDWGIWGHNLSNVLPEKPSNTVFARYDGTTDRHQFCFSSEKLFDYISNYIGNNYGRNDSINFAILPNDNDIVCQCSVCVKAGNTSTDATPAVLKMITKLCEKFPNHTFFTSYYATTRSIPKNKLPKNSGVLVSAIGYPLVARSTPQEAEFKNLLTQWRQKSNKVYVWDYINNFDDYFTPYPVFNVMQHRLKLYNEAGVEGVFLNGSGQDFSTFSFLHKAVLAKMLINPDIDWRAELRKTAKEYYPKAGDDIADFIIAQEDYAASTGKTLPLYEGVENSLKSYLQAEPTRELYAKVQQHMKTAGGKEKRRLEDLESALAFTILELNRIEGNLEGSEELLQKLERFPRMDIEYYNESLWPIVNYIGNYERLLRDYNETSQTNLLKGVRLGALGPLDEEYNDISILTDGRLGIPSNYHSGNMINSADPSFSVSIPRKPGMKKLVVWLAYNPAYKIGLPSEVVLTSGRTTLSEEPRRPSQDTGHSKIEFMIPQNGGELKLKFVKDPEVKSFAIEEIQGFAVTEE